MKVRAAILAAAMVSGALLARAEENLPPGLVRSGGVIMMRPISDGETSNTFSVREHRPGTIRVLSTADRDLLTRAFDAADRADWASALSLAAQSHDDTGRKLIEWRRLLDKSSGATFSDLDTFIKSNPGWPLRETLYQRAESAIGPELAPSGVVAWFGGRTPASSIGRIKLGEAMIVSGRETEGRNFIREGWREGFFDPPQEATVLQKDGRYLTPDDDRARLDNLLWRDLIGDAKRQLSRVDARTGRIGEARIALRTQPEQAGRVLEKLSAYDATDPSLLFDRARTAPHLGNNQQAESFLLRLEPRGPARAHPPAAWNVVNAEA